MLILSSVLQINDFAVTTLILALEENKSLTALNLEGKHHILNGMFYIRDHNNDVMAGNKISPDTLANLFESLATYPNTIIELRLAGQQQEKMGFRWPQ